MGLNPHGTDADGAAGDEVTADARRPDIGQPAVGETGVGGPDVSEPEVGGPYVSESEVGESDVSEPAVGKPRLGELHIPATTFGGHQMVSGRRDAEASGNPAPTPTVETSTTAPSPGLGIPRTRSTASNSGSDTATESSAKATGAGARPVEPGAGSGTAAGAAMTTTRSAIGLDVSVTRGTTAFPSHDAARSITATPLPAHTREWEQRLLADPNLLADIAFAVGGPFHVMYPEQVAENIRGFGKAFAAAGVDGAIFYGKKANKAGCVARVCANQGVGVDVSSVGELTAALAQGVRGPDLMVTGPAKSDELLRLAARHNALIAIDTPDELDRLAAVAVTGPARILLRVRPSGSASRFGMTETELDQSISRLTPPPNTRGQADRAQQTIGATVTGRLALPSSPDTATPGTLHLHTRLAGSAERLGLSGNELDHLITRIAAPHSYGTEAVPPETLHLRTRIGASLGRLGLTSDGFASVATRLGIRHHRSAPVTRAGHAAADRIASDRILLEGFSFHLSGYDPIARADLAHALVDRTIEARAKGHSATTISIGGGFGVDYVPATAWSEFTEQVGDQWFHSGKTFNSYYPYHFPAPGPAMLTSILEHRGLAQRLRDNAIRLAIEPGRALLAGAGSTVFRVQGRKTRTAEGQSYDLLTVDGTSLSLSEQWFDSEYLPDPVLWPSRPGGTRTPTSVGAASCLESDMLSWRRIPLPRRAELGDLLIYPNTAGYQMDSNESAFHELPIPPKVVLHDLGDRLRWTLDSG